MSIPTEQLRVIDPVQIAMWLRANDWTLEASVPGRNANWSRAANANERFEVDLPLDSGFRDYARRLQELIDTLVIAHARDERTLLTEIRASTVDTVRLRATGPAVGQGRAPLELGSHLFAQARELLTAAASAANDPRNVYRGRRPAPVQEFLRRAWFCPPEPGSFVITIQVPLVTAPQLDVPFDPQHDDLAIRPSAVLARASAAARQAAEQMALGDAAGAFAVVTQQGVSANLCEALASMVDGTDVNALDLSFRWATSRPAPVAVPQSLHISAELSPLLMQGARYLRQRGTTPDFDVDGLVVQLESDDPTRGGYAVVRTAVDGSARKVRIRLPADDYAIAIQAHDQRRALRCEGELTMQGQQYHLERVRQVSLVVED